MISSHRYVSLRDYLRVLRDYRILIVLMTAVFAVAANRISNKLTPTYSAQASVALADLNQDLTLAGLPTSTTSPLPSQTPVINVELASTQSILGPAVASMHHRYRHLTVPSLRSSLSARVEAQSNLVILQVSSGNPGFAALAADQVAKADVAYVTKQERARIQQAADGLRTQLHQIQRSSTDQAARAQYADTISKLRSLTTFAQGGQVTQLARVPTSASFPNPVRDSILAGLVGLTLAIVIAFLRSSLDRRIRSTAQIQHELGITALSRVAASAMGRAGVASNGRKKMTAEDLEAFRILHSNLDFLVPDGRLVSVAVTSPLSQEGKSTVAASLAFASAWVGRRTILVEADLRRPSLAKRTGLKSDPGLSELLAGTAALEGVVQEMPGVRRSANGNGSAPESANGDHGAKTDGSSPGALDVISAGGRTDVPAELLGSDAFRELLAELSRQYDAVILDTAPLLPVADSLRILPQVDCVLVCVRVGRTRGDELRAAREALEHLPARPLGLVVTGVRRGDESDYGYYPPNR